MAKPQGRCIFCQGFHLSKEHLFADWLRDLFPRDLDTTHTIGDTDSGKWRITGRQGHSGSKKIRTVCKPCNSGWISGIDEAAKYVATPLIRGEVAAVAPEKQKVLAAWFGKIAAVADSRNRKRSVVPLTQRAYIKQTRQPPDEWEIWLASYGGTDWRDLGLLQNGGHLDFTPVRGPGEQFTGYAETTFIGMGRLVALVIADDFPMVDFNVGRFANIARRIWPVGGTFEWPLGHVLTDEGAMSAARIMDSMMTHFRS